MYYVAPDAEICQCGKVCKYWIKPPTFTITMGMESVESLE